MQEIKHIHVDTNIYQYYYISSSLDSFTSESIHAPDKLIFKGENCFFQRWMNHTFRESVSWPFLSVALFDEGNL